MKDFQDVLKGAPILPILALKNADDAIPACRAVREAKLQAVEFVLRSDAALKGLAKAAATFPEMELGAGTVISKEQAKAALDAGAKFIVSPGFDRDLVEFCLAAGVATLPGCVTPGEVQAAVSLGLRTLKFFPAFEMGGTSMLRQLAGPFPQVRFIPTGAGMNLENALKFLECGNVVAVGGAWMFSPGGVALKIDMEKVIGHLSKIKGGVK